MEETGTAISRLEISPWDVTKGLLDATQIWSEYLTGVRDANDWSVAGAFEFFAALDLQAPSEPIPVDALVSFRCMVQEAERARNDPKSFTIKRNTESRMQKVADKVSSYLSTNCGLTFADKPPENVIETTIASLGEAAMDVKARTSSPQAAYVMFNTKQASPLNDYSVLDRKIDVSSLPADEASLVSETLEPEYWEPQPTAEEFAQSIGAGTMGAAEPGSER